MVFGRLTVLSFAGFNQHRNTLWECLCSCGNRTVVTCSSLTSNGTKSCGCLRRQSGRNLHHGHARKNGTPEYRSWRAMWNRCTNRSHDGWKNYGGRGIAVCERWRSFVDFLADMGSRPRGTTLEREDSNGNYEPGNCRWATPTEQQANTRQSVLLTLDGQTFCIAEWARRLGLKEDTLRKRYHSGWDTRRILTALPVRFAQSRKPPTAASAHDSAIYANKRQASHR